MIATVPRLELVAAALLVTLMHHLSEQTEVDLDKTILWCDSMTVQSYLKIRTSSFTTFGDNRMRLLQQWVPTIDRSHRSCIRESVMYFTWNTISSAWLGVTVSPSLFLALLPHRRRVEKSLSWLESIENIWSIFRWESLYAHHRVTLIPKD